MTALAILVLAATATLAAALIAHEIRHQTRELRAIAEQEADERRNRGLEANKAARWQG